MQVDQAIFTSVASGRVQGYQLAARSDGIDDRLSQTLTRWGPSHAALCSSDPSAESFNFHAVDDGLFALSRTIYGGPEYSRRGGLQLMTRYALLQRPQLQEFRSDPLTLMRLARTEGRLALVTRFEKRLPPLTLPGATAAVFWAAPAREEQPGLANDVAARLANGERLAVTHCGNPFALLQQVFRLLPEAQRLDVSFTTGLKPTAHRPFQLHFLPGDSPETRRSAVALGLTCLSASA